MALKSVQPFDYFRDLSAMSAAPLQAPALGAFLRATFFSKKTILGRDLCQTCFAQAFLLNALPSDATVCTD